MTPLNKPTIPLIGQCDSVSSHNKTVTIVIVILYYINNIEQSFSIFIFYHLGNQLWNQILMQFI